MTLPFAPPTFVPVLFETEELVFFTWVPTRTVVSLLGDFFFIVVLGLLEETGVLLLLSLELVFAEFDDFFVSFLSVALFCSGNSVFCVNAVKTGLVALGSCSVPDSVAVEVIAEEFLERCARNTPLPVATNNKSVIAEPMTNSLFLLFGSSGNAWYVFMSDETTFGPTSDA